MTHLIRLFLIFYLLLCEDVEILWNVCWGRSEIFSGECPLLLYPTAALIMCIAASSVIFTSAGEPSLGLTSTTSTADNRCVLYDSSIIWIPSRNVKPPRTVWSAREIYIIFTGKNNTIYNYECKKYGKSGTVH